MVMRRLIFFLIFFIGISFLKSYAQNGCSTIGQTPSTAFPVCGTDTFSQSTVPFCGGKKIPVPPCVNSGNSYNDINPFWYKFTCFKSGTLGFTITPTSNNDDYDWQIFDITNRNPDDVYTDGSLFISCNWSGLKGVTGTNSTAANISECGSFGSNNPPIFSKMPSLVQGRNYLLMISNFSQSQQGYKLEFSKGTASITDTASPAMTTAKAACDGTLIRIKLNKKMKCASLAANGSDFAINYPLSSVIKAVGNKCTTSFDMDSVTIYLNNPLPFGNYQITAKIGNDSNTLLDNCGTAMPVSSSVAVTIFPVTVTPMDSLTKPGCSPKQLQLVFKKPMRCNSVAANGSDFEVTGTGGNKLIKEARGYQCNADGVSDIILVTLNNPIQTEGSFAIVLKKGTDGNTIIDECGQETPPGASLPFTTVDTVNAIFNYTINYGCTSDTVRFTHDGRNKVTAWNWGFEDKTNYSQQQFVKIFTTLGKQKATLKVTNGVCIDSVSQNLLLDYDTLKSSFQIPPYLCPNDTLTIQNVSTGKNLSYLWNLNNGSINRSQSPENIKYAIPLDVSKKYDISLTVVNGIGCVNKSTESFTALRSCFIAVPTAFTPNNDGINDYLYPLNAYKADKLMFRIYNRFGQLLFETRDWTKKWDGKINGQLQPSGTYVWMLYYINRDTGKEASQKGTTVLIR